MALAEELEGRFQPFNLAKPEDVDNTLFERIFLSRMMAVRSVQDAIPDHQFGLRSHHGTPEQAHQVTQHILGAFENKQYS